MWSKTIQGSTIIDSNVYTLNFEEKNLLLAAKI